MPTLLLILLGLPLAAACVVGLLGPGRGPLIRQVSLATTLVVLLLAVRLAVEFVGLPRGGHATFHPEFVPGAPADDPHATTWDLLVLGPGRVQFYVGLDGLNVWLVLLTALLMVASVLISWTGINERVNEFYAWLLALETGMLGVFLAFDIILFYVFFELTLVPLVFLIGIWGGPQRQYAARKFFVYTLAGSLITLLGVLGVALTLYQEGEPHELTFSVPRLVAQVRDHGKRVQDDYDQAVRAAGAAPADVREVEDRRLDDARARLDLWRRVQFWVFVALMCGFAVKVPLVPLHTWLPLAHTEAPTAGSVLLAGVLLKIGTYGFLRLCVPLAPDASLTFGAPLIGTLAVVGILYGSFCALAQADMKKMVAYSSVGHLGFCMLGLFALNEVGLQGSLLTMINHGLSTGALFLLVGMLYERYHTRMMADYGGMAARLKVLATFMVFITMSSIGLPGLNGFVGEFLVMAGMYDFQGPWVDGRLLTSLAVLGVLLGAWYMLTLLRRVFFGPVKEPGHGEGHGGPPAEDMTGREWAALLPIAALCLLIGVYPKPVLDAAAPDLGVVARIADEARGRLERDAEARAAAPGPADRRAAEAASRTAPGE
jgi:NADH-quinone oxidoreductase subunit M